MKHQVDVATAKAMIGRANGPTSWTFDREVIDAMLAQEGATGLRIYRARGRDGMATPVVVATGKDGADLLGVIAEEATPCPPFCAPASELAP